MKKILFSALIVLFSMTGFSQVFKCKTYQSAVRSLNTSGYWSDWSSWYESDILVTFDFNNNRIVIYSKTVQVFDIIEYLAVTYDADGDKTSEMLTVDQDAIRANLRLVTRYSQGGVLQLYVDYSNLIIVYEMYVLD
jgi:hypothetical protein